MPAADCTCPPGARGPVAGCAAHKLPCCVCGRPQDEHRAESARTMLAGHLAAVSEDRDGTRRERDDAWRENKALRAQLAAAERERDAARARATALRAALERILAAARDDALTAPEACGAIEATAADALTADGGA